MSKNDEAVSEDGGASPETTESKSKKTAKKGRPSKRSQNNLNRENGEPSSKKKVTKPMSIELDRVDAETEEELGDVADSKVPLLDQPAVIEGSRSRKTIERFVQKAAVPVPKRSSKVEIPKGPGKALGRITSVFTRLRKLDDAMIKQLHKALFGKNKGKTIDLMNNLVQFRGFLFEKGTVEYDNKWVDIGENFALSEMRSLMYTFDIDAKYKSKEEAVTLILDFLLCPQPLKNTKAPLEGHPRRRATKRNYFEADLDFESLRKKQKKKKKTTEASSEETEKGTETPKKTPSKQSRKSKKSVEVVEENEQPEKTGDLETENDSESKKPAKKRKRNQVIDGNEEEEPLSAWTNGTEKPAKDAGKKKPRGKRASS